MLEKEHLACCVLFIIGLAWSILELVSFLWTFVSLLELKRFWEKIIHSTLEGSLRPCYFIANLHLSAVTYLTTFVFEVDSIVIFLVCMSGFGLIVSHYTL